MLRAWRALATFEDRAGVRPWLYRIATNVCLDMLKGRSRRALPMDVAPVATGELRPGDPRPEATWIQPAPDSLILPREVIPLSAPSHGSRCGSHSSPHCSTSLPASAPCSSCAMCCDGVPQRSPRFWRPARTRSTARSVEPAPRATGVDRDSAPSQPAADESELLAAYIDAFDRGDIDALVGVLRDDAILEMPPFELWLQGRDAIRRFLLAVDGVRDELVTPVERERVTGRCRVPAGNDGGPPDRVRHPRARRHCRAHQRLARLPRPGAVRSVRPSDRTRGLIPHAAPAAPAQVQHVVESGELEQLDQAPVAR